MSDMQGALYSRRGEVEQSRAVAAKQMDIRGKVSLSDAGETLHEVNFPYWFIAEPYCISGGGVLAEGQVLEDGNFPRWSVGVKNWKTLGRGSTTFYTGAVLVVVAEGHARMRSSAHWQVSGMAVPGQVGTE